MVVEEKRYAKLKREIEDGLIFPFLSVPKSSQNVQKETSPNFLFKKVYIFSPIEVSDPASYKEMVLLISNNFIFFVVEEESLYI